MVITLDMMHQIASEKLRVLAIAAPPISMETQLCG